MKTKANGLFLLGIAVVGLVAATGGAWWYLSSSRGATSPPAPAGPSPAPEYHQATEQEIDVVRRALRPEGIIALAIDRFKIGMERYPRGIHELLEKPTDLTRRERWDGPYINNDHLLFDPWDQPYRYAHPGAHNDYGYDLWSIGPDGQNDTTDDIGNW